MEPDTIKSALSCSLFEAVAKTIDDADTHAAMIGPASNNAICSGGAETELEAPLTVSRISLSFDTHDVITPTAEAARLIGMTSALVSAGRAEASLAARKRKLCQDIVELVRQVHGLRMGQGMQKQDKVVCPCLGRL